MPYTRSPNQAGNRNSDVRAKGAFIRELLAQGFESAEGTQIKYTAQATSYFGAATLTEWEAAIHYEGRFSVVVAAERDGEWMCHEYTPEAFMQFRIAGVPPQPSQRLEPSTIVSPETLRVSIRFTHSVPRDATLMVHMCGMETAQLIGRGTCTTGFARVAFVELIGPGWEQGIVSYRNGAATTTHFVFVGVGVLEGTPRPIDGARAPVAG